MTTESASNRISAQIVGAYGERVVEAELLRRGWLASNVNASIKNAADFDIFALKRGRTVHVRVKTCGPSTPAFQFNLGRSEAAQEQPSSADFTVLVRMGVTRHDDEFYVVPTKAVRETLAAYKRFYLATLRRDGRPRKDTGHWTLHLISLRSGEDRPNYGLAAKWSDYRDRWDLLET